MIGNHPDIKDIELDLQALVLPANLVAEESLSPDSEADEEEEQQPYRVDTCCRSCGTGVRLCVISTQLAIRTLQQILVQELSLVCPGCSRTIFQHGRTR
uniref:Protein E7 n=1 Tax=Human papillomavirus TaxID=10566 RepID=A0A385PR59_9PAPI|nr:MAG: E7 protein [Human papillomavirus]